MTPWSREAAAFLICGAHTEALGSQGSDKDSEIMDTPLFQERLSSLTLAPSPPSGLRRFVGRRAGAPGRGASQVLHSGALLSLTTCTGGGGVGGFLPGERRYGCLAVGSF